jgi:hypothetical protein
MDASPDSTGEAMYGDDFVIEVVYLNPLYLERIKRS